MGIYRHNLLKYSNAKCGHVPLNNMRLKQTDLTWVDPDSLVLGKTTRWREVLKSALKGSYFIKTMELFKRFMSLWWGGAVLQRGYFVLRVLLSQSFTKKTQNIVQLNQQATIHAHMFQSHNCNIHFLFIVSLSSFLEKKNTCVRQQFCGRIQKRPI